eukprot:jgi/Ulvmu1/4711/UM002_0442.1
MKNSRSTAVCRPVPAALKAVGNNARAGAGSSTSPQKPLKTGTSAFAVQKKRDRSGGIKPQQCTASARSQISDAPAAAIQSVRPSNKSSQTSSRRPSELVILKGSRTRQRGADRQRLDSQLGLCEDLACHRRSRETADAKNGHTSNTRKNPSTSYGQGAENSPTRRYGRDPITKGDNRQKPGRKQQGVQDTSVPSAAGDAGGHPANTRSAKGRCNTIGANTKAANQDNHAAGSGVKRKLSHDLILTDKRRRKPPNRSGVSEMAATPLDSSPNVTGMRTASPEGAAIARKMRELEHEFDDSVRPLLDQEKGQQKSLRNQLGNQSHLRLITEALNQRRDPAMDCSVAVADLPYLPSPPDTGDHRSTYTKKNKSPQHGECEAVCTTSSDTGKDNIGKCSVDDNEHAALTQSDDPLGQKNEELEDLCRQLRHVTDENVKLRTKADNLASETGTLQSLLSKEQAKVAELHAAGGAQRRLSDAHRKKDFMEVRRMHQKAVKKLEAVLRDFEAVHKLLDKPMS